MFKKLDSFFLKQDDDGINPQNRPKRKENEVQEGNDQGQNSCPFLFFHQADTGDEFRSGQDGDKERPPKTYDSQDDYGFIVDIRNECYSKKNPENCKSQKETENPCNNP